MNTSRIKTISFTFYFIFLAIIVRLFYWQIIEHAPLSRTALAQSYKIIPVSPSRGLIFDSTHQPLALNQTLFQISLYKPNTQNLPAALKQLVSVYPDETAADLQLLNQFTQNDNQKWITLSHFFTSSDVASLSDPLYSSSPVEQRFYPEKDYYQNITGFLGKNDLGDITGYGGLEGYYHKILSGRSGYQFQNQDAVGQALISDQDWSSPAVDGRNLDTSINPIIQYDSYRLLADGIKKYQADSGSIIVMKPDTGEILALVSLDASPSAGIARNHPLADLYEPGSIFKPIVMSAALDTKSITPSWICAGCSHPRTIGQYTISNWDNSLHPDSSLPDIIKNSDNIGMSYVIDQLGLNNFLKYFEALGLNHTTGIDLQGESRPPQKTNWPDIDLATAGFGQGFAITQIQMITAFNTIANDGVLVKPHIVSAFEDGGNIIPVNLPPPKVIYQPATISLMKQILSYAVNNSPVTQYKPKDLDVCAKSGTAQVSVQGSYSDTQVTASYVGFSPCIHPKFTILITLNHPQNALWGSTSAAPMWYQLAALINPLL